MDIYNIALDEHAFWLADMLDPFARGFPKSNTFKEMYQA